MDAFINRQAFPIAQQGFLQAHHALAAEQYRRDPLLHGGIKLSGGHKFLQKADAIRFRCIDDVAGVDEFGGLAPADQLGQQHRFHARRNTDAHFGHAELRAIDADAHIACGSEFHAEAETISVDTRDHRHRKRAYRFVGHMGERVFNLGFLGRQVFHFVNVRAGDEGFITCAGDDGGAQRVVLRQAVKGFRYRALARHAQRVAPRGVVDGQISDAAPVVTMVTIVIVAALLDAGEQQVAHLTSTLGIFSAWSCSTLGATSWYSARRVLENNERIFSVHGVFRASCAAGLSHTSGPVSS